MPSLHSSKGVDEADERMNKAFLWFVSFLKTNRMNKIERKVKWELITSLLAVILMMGVFMLCSEKEEETWPLVENQYSK